MGLTTTILRSRAVAALTSPQGVDRYLEQVNPMWAAHEVRARIVDVHREVDVPGHPPVATITLQPTSTWRGHRAGQHVQLGVEVDGARRTTRVFTISSPDSRPGDRFTITLRANPDGRRLEVTSSSAREPGTMVHLSQAQGDFVLPDRVPEHVLFISGGSGITPVMSMLRSLQRRTHRGRVTFVHYAQSPEHQIFAARARRDPSLRPRHRPAPAAPRARRPEPVAGVPRAAGAGLPRRPDLGLRPGAADRGRPRGVRRLGVAPRRVLPAAAHLRHLRRGRRRFARSGQEAPNTGATLLEQAEALGLKPEFGCRMGICFSCTSRKSEGTVRNVLTGEESSLPDEDIRVCVSAPVGDCVVDL